MSKLRCNKCLSFLPNTPNQGLTNEVFEYDHPDEEGAVHPCQGVLSADPHWRCARCGHDTHEPKGLCDGDESDLNPNV